MAKQQWVEPKVEVVDENHGNTRLPFGLCKRYGISLPEGSTPRDAWNALEGKGITRKQVYDALKRSGTVKNVKAEPKKMTEDQFLAKKGLYGMSDVGLDTSRIPHGETQRQRDKRIKEENEKATEYYGEKQKAREEYDEKVKSGEISAPSTVDRLIEAAKGHEDNEQTKAAIRSLEKRAMLTGLLVGQLKKYSASRNPEDEEKQKRYFKALGEYEKINSALKEIADRKKKTYKETKNQIKILVDEKGVNAITNYDINALVDKGHNSTDIQNAIDFYRYSKTARKKNPELEKQYQETIKRAEEKTQKITSTDRYKESHDEIIDFVKNQVGIDLNKYRDGNGDDPYTTAYWDKSGYKVAINRKALTKEDQNRLNELIAKGKIKQEQGGSWIDYISFGENKERNKK